ncbi:GNAT family N-acetyltransferase [Azohydromonas australica]|uniref:GNAT family N-acetyltransferase n=1 Tax=Azohydromonas australica TaxID=364039 RepID=UPI00048E873A|nr:GNAT family protein [Azohydromonas australica]
MSWPEGVTLQGRHASLRLLSHADAPALALAVQEGDLWKLWVTRVPAPEEMEAEIARRLGLHEKGSMTPYAILDAQGTPVGMTSYMNVDPVNRRVEIGSTWIAQRVQRTPLNTECKFLLLQRAFEALDCLAVEFRTHRLNFTSRRAIERLGAQLDGILRHHQRLADGTVRDTAVYSITAPEWPTVRRHLQAKLQH